MVGKSTIIGKDEKSISPMRTAFTDGLNCAYFEEYIETLTDQELRFVILHENLGHKMHRHLTTWQNLFRENATLANIATDLYVNAMILRHNDPGVSMPKGGLYDKKYDDCVKWDSYHIFQDLKKNGLPQSMKCDGNCKQGDGSGNPGGQCTCQGFDEHGWDEADGMSDAEKREAEQAIDSAIRQGAILAGKMNGNIDRSISDLLEIKTDWRDVLREFMTNNVKGGDETAWRRPARRYVAEDIYMPSTITDSMGDIVIGIDTSGSISGPDLTLFLSHVVRIMTSVRPESVRLLYWDTRVAGDEAYTPDRYDVLASSTKPKGGGGTSPSCVPKYLQDKKIKPQIVVMVSDGYVDSVPTDFGCPVIWAISGHENFVAPSGQVVLQLPETL